MRIVVPVAVLTGQEIGGSADFPSESRMAVVGEIDGGSLLGDRCDLDRRGVACDLVSRLTDYPVETGDCCQRRIGFPLGIARGSLREKPVKVFRMLLHPVN